jgi:hypothetical protein
MQTMREIVLPETKKLFVAYDGERFGEFGCPTCHGEDMQKVGFKMPNKLPGLPSADTLAKARAHDPKLAEFMEKQVVPKMAELFDEPPSTDGAGPGFGCFGCHPRE